MIIHIPAFQLQELLEHLIGYPQTLNSFQDMEAQKTIQECSENPKESKKIEDIEAQNTTEKTSEDIANINESKNNQTANKNVVCLACFVTVRENLLEKFCWYVQSHPPTV